jgi:glycosyltransferase involved in cell wall biosynthesis
MQPVSVVVIAKNEAHVIGRTLQSIQQLTDNIIVCDTGSTDATIPIAQLNGARIIELGWEGYGVTKNLANEYAEYDWILQLDADEVPDEALLASLLNLQLHDEQVIYGVTRKNYYAGRYLQYGQWRNDQCIRLFNRKNASWSDDAVHEKLVSNNAKTILLNGFIHHYTYETVQEHIEKIEEYTTLDAAKMKRNGKKCSWLKMTFAPLIVFITNYFFKLGFMDGYYGFIAAKLSSRHTALKYQKLRALYRKKM